MLYVCKCTYIYRINKILTGIEDITVFNFSHPPTPYAANRNKGKNNKSPLAVYLSTTTAGRCISRLPRVQIGRRRY